MTRSSLIIALFAVLFGWRIIAATRKQRLPEQHSLLWLGVASVILLLAAWREGIDVLARATGIYYPPSVLFLAASAGLMWLVYQQSVELAEQRQQLRQLTRELALLNAPAPRRPDAA